MIKTGFDGHGGNEPVPLYWSTPIPIGVRACDWLERKTGSATLELQVQGYGDRIIFVPFTVGLFFLSNPLDIHKCGEDIQGFLESIPFNDRYHVLLLSLEPFESGIVYPEALFAPRPSHGALLLTPTRAAQEYVEEVGLYGFDEVPYTEPRTLPRCARRFKRPLLLDLSGSYCREQRMRIVANLVISLHTPLVLHECMPVANRTVVIERAPTILASYAEPRLKYRGCHPRKLKDGRIKTKVWQALPPVST